MTVSLPDQYLKDLLETGSRSDARGEIHYPALKTMLEAFARDRGRAEVRVTCQPPATASGNPDFRIWNGRDRIIGYTVLAAHCVTRK